MAQFTLEMPTEIMEDIRKIEENADTIFGNMTKSAAEMVASKVRSNAPISELGKSVKVSKVYKTPSDNGINTKVYFSGYKSGVPFTRRGRSSSKKYVSEKGMPWAFLAMVYEYGTSQRTTDAGSNRGSFRKKPFFRKCFNQGEIEAIMRKVQSEESGGLLE